MEILKELPNEMNFNVIKFMKHPVAEIVKTGDFSYARFEILHKILERNSEHGSAFDRGMADAYYNRDMNPHKWIIQEGQRPIRDEDLSDEEIEEYEIGFEFTFDRKIY